MKIEGTTISFDLYDVIQNCTEARCLEIIDAMSLHADVRRFVLDHLLDGETQFQSRTDWAGEIADRKRILDAIPDLERAQIEALESDLHVARKSLQAERARIAAVRRVLGGYRKEPFYPSPALVAAIDAALSGNG